jgi:hypothetical protein
MRRPPMRFTPRYRQRLKNLPKPHTPRSVATPIEESIFDMSRPPAANSRLTPGCLSFPVIFDDPTAGNTLECLILLDCKTLPSARVNARALIHLRDGNLNACQEASYSIMALQSQPLQNPLYIKPKSRYLLPATSTRRTSWHAKNKTHRPTTPVNPLT